MPQHRRSKSKRRSGRSSKRRSGRSSKRRSGQKTLLFRASVQPEHWLDEVCSACREGACNIRTTSELSVAVQFAVVLMYYMTDTLFQFNESQFLVQMALTKLEGELVKTRASKGEMGRNMLNCRKALHDLKLTDTFNSENSTPLRSVTGFTNYMGRTTLGDIYDSVKQVWDIKKVFSRISPKGYFLEDETPFRLLSEEERQEMEDAYSIETALPGAEAPVSLWLEALSDAEASLDTWSEEEKEMFLRYISHFLGPSELPAAPTTMET